MDKSDEETSQNKLEKSGNAELPLGKDSEATPSLSNTEDALETPPTPQDEESSESEENTLEATPSRQDEEDAPPEPPLDKSNEEQDEEDDDPAFSAYTGRRAEYEEVTQKEKDAEAYKAEKEKEAMRELLLGSEKEPYSGDYAYDGKSLSYVKMVIGLQIMTGALFLVLRFFPNPLFQNIFDKPSIPLGLGLLFFATAFLVYDNGILSSLGAFCVNTMTPMYLAVETFDLLRDREKAMLAVFPAMLTCMIGFAGLILCYRFFKNRDFHL